MTSNPNYDIAELNKQFRITKGKLFLKKNSGLLGAIICNVEFGWDESIKTAQTNGKYIKWNPHFYLSLDQETRVTVLAHEAWHIAMLHMTRIGNRDCLLWNIAADIVINNMLHNEGFIFNTSHIHEPSYGGMTTEEVYNKLVEFNPSFNSMGINGDSGDIVEAGSEEDGKEVLNKVVQAVTQAKMSAGNIPGEVELVIDKFLHPILPWETLLQNYMTELSDDDRSYTRPNRRYSEIFMPSDLGFNGLAHIIYFLDVSGSITDYDILRFHSEFKHVKEIYNPERMTMVTFDEIIQKVVEIDKYDEFSEIKITGRGGTNLEPVVKFANSHEADAVIIFTDLQVRIPETKIKSPVLWVCNDASIEAPYGSIIHIIERNR